MPTLMHWLGQSWFVAAVDLLLVFLVVYEALKLLKGTRAAQVAVGIAIVAFLYQASHWLHLPTLEFVIRHSLLYVGFAVVVLFQNEIRLAFANFGKNIRLLSRLGWRTQKLSVVQYEDVLLAVATLAANKTGALIVFERQDNLDEYISRGSGWMPFSVTICSSISSTPKRRSTMVRSSSARIGLLPPVASSP